MTETSLLSRLGGIRRRIERYSDIDDMAKDYKIPKREMRGTLISVIQSFQDLEKRLRAEGVRTKLAGGDFWYADEEEPPIEEIRSGDRYERLEDIGGSISLDIHERDSKDPDFCLAFYSKYSGLNFEDVGAELVIGSDDQRELKKVIKSAIPNKFYFKRDRMGKVERYVINEHLKSFLSEFVNEEIEKKRFGDEYLFFPSSKALLTYLGSDELVSEIVVRAESKRDAENLRYNLDKIVDFAKSIRPVVARAYKEAGPISPYDKHPDFYDITARCLNALREIDPSFSVLKPYRLTDEMKDRLEEHFIEKLKGYLVVAADREIKFRAEGSRRRKKKND